MYWLCIRLKKGLRSFMKYLIRTLLFSVLFSAITVSAVWAQDSTWSERRRRIIQERVLPRTLYGRDNPFAPLITEEPKKPKVKEPRPELVLNGIVWSKTSPRAIINEIFVGVGDKIFGMNVVSIQKERVILEDEKSRYILNTYGLIEVEEETQEER